VDDKELDRKYQIVRELVGGFPETFVQANVDPETGNHVFLVQVATAEQALRLEIDAQWFAIHTEEEIHGKLAAYDVLAKLRTSGGMAVKIDPSTCP